LRAARQSNNQNNRSTHNFQIETNQTPKKQQQQNKTKQNKKPWLRSRLFSCSSLLISSSLLLLDKKSTRRAAAICCGYVVHLPGDGNWKTRHDSRQIPPIVCFSSVLDRALPPMKAASCKCLNASFLGDMIPHTFSLFAYQDLWTPQGLHQGVQQEVVRRRLPQIGIAGEV
jgi:hypothetical protein